MEKITANEFVQILIMSANDYLKYGVDKDDNTELSYNNHFKRFDMWLGEVDEHADYFNTVLEDIRNNLDQPQGQ